MNNHKNMFKKTIIAILSVLLLIPCLTLAQTETEELNQSQLEAVITSEDFVRVGKKIIFDAGDSTLFLDSPYMPIYNWQFGDSFYDSGDQVVHQYDKTGVYSVELTLSQGEDVTSTFKNILIYDSNQKMD